MSFKKLFSKNIFVIFGVILIFGVYSKDLLGKAKLYEESVFLVSPDLGNGFRTRVQKDIFGLEDGAYNLVSNNAPISGGGELGLKLVINNSYGIKLGASYITTLLYYKGNGKAILYKPSVQTSTYGVSYSKLGALNCEYSYFFSYMSVFLDVYFFPIKEKQFNIFIGFGAEYLIFANEKIEITVSDGIYANLNMVDEFSIKGRINSRILVGFEKKISNRLSIILFIMKVLGSSVFVDDSDYSDNLPSSYSSSLSDEEKKLVSYDVGYVNFEHFRISIGISYMIYSF
jgi:hypothetical protein